MLKKLLAACSGFTEFLTILDGFDQPICIKDVTDPNDRIIMFANKAFLRMSGYRLAEIVGKTATDLEWPDYTTREIECDTKPEHAFSELHCAICPRYVMFAKDGTLLCHEMTTEQVEYDGRHYLLSVHKSATANQLIEINAIMSTVKREFKDFRQALDKVFKPFQTS